MVNKALSQNPLNCVDTITAQATPAGRGGIAAIRVSGPLVRDIIPILLARPVLPPRTAIYAPFLDNINQPIDEGIAIFFPAPHSFTGEDVLELHGHGSPVVIDLLLQRIIQLGARLARAGEFSERAFLNNKIDLTQAEAIADLIDAASQQAARLAMRSLQGEFSKTIQLINEKVIALRLYIEASIDFSDEPIPFLTDQRIKQDINIIYDDLQQIERQASQGALLREGMIAVIAGLPNVGKSSLLNALSGEETAIVTEIPGTTRDVLREKILIDGVPLHIIDTAGIRDSEDLVEQEGIKRAKRMIAEADIILHVSDVTKAHNQNIDETIYKNIPNELYNIDIKNSSIIFVRNKIDLIPDFVPKIEKTNTHTTVFISAASGAGIDLLKQCLLSNMGLANQEEGLFLARLRHLDALSRAKHHVQNGLQQIAAISPMELVAEDLRLCQQALSEITGEFRSDDLLGRIFSSFCIGK